ncbi:hypothetical protein [Salicibibacter kimchii]|uniref:Uncharacterized protein n=1 Tax=Salicibibacter kimchii TaxID=2099786 RepID=A0A345C2K7_9BACI|nr:hypothetical protein [Salicibibacter kimchii]AXF57438.1 hypothetical protein DT065_16560 [Salicibibacter kimchii]
MLKKFLTIFMMSFVFVFVFTSLSSTASAYSSEDYIIEPPFNGEFQFTTGDGEWDGVIPNSHMFHVRLGVSSVLPSSDLNVRLCNSESGNCTPYKSFAGSSAFFSDMMPGIYYIDIVSTTRNGSGTVTFHKQ